MSAIIFYYFHIKHTISLNRRDMLIFLNHRDLIRLNADIILSKLPIPSCIYVYIFQKKKSDIHRGAIALK